MGSGSSTGEDKPVNLTPRPCFDEPVQTLLNLVTK